ncbi:MAG: hypothetical protein Q7T50_00640 [Candidatus Magasanikbacteria bacterium]|nr:hypothetical protein [Candidatus Magasanikbacteria bacterium]
MVYLAGGALCRSLKYYNQYEAEMIKLISEKEFDTYLEGMVKHFVDFYKENPWNISRKEEKIEEYFRCVLLYSFHRFIVELSDEGEVIGFLMAYPANFLCKISAVPESTISLFVDFTSTSKELWNYFLKTIEKAPFRNLMSLTISGTEIYKFLEAEDFRKIGEVQNSADKNQFRWPIMKKIMNFLT